MTIVKLSGIKKYFSVKRGYLRQTAGIVKAVDGVSLAIEKGRTFGLVGESGCGKTTLGKIILGIIRPDSGEIEVNTEKPQVIFQDPYSSLDPKMRISDIVAEGLAVKDRRPGFGGQGSEVRNRVEAALDLVRLSKGAFKKYPHQFSGGERQRIAIARAIITDPEFIVCDEPVSNLDVTVQLEILRLLKDLQNRLSVTCLFISHDLRVIRFMSDMVAVMKEGRIVEEGTAQNIYSNPTHPYTRLLVSSILDIAAK